MRFQFQPSQSQYTSIRLVTDGQVYLANTQNKNTLYRYNTQTNAVDSIELSYPPLYVLKRMIQGKQGLLVTSSSGYYLHDPVSLKLFQHIPATKPLSDTGEPTIAGSKMYCLLQKNELACYNLDTKKALWSITTPPKAAKWLGITIGTFNDMFTSYALSSDGATLYAATAFGCLYKINAATGAVIKQIDRFRGDANNAGLITEFVLADVNGDGVEDMIGSAVDYNIYAISGKDLSLLWAYNTGYESQAGVSLYDVTGDGVVDVFTINDNMKLSVINGKTGGKILEHQIQPEKEQAKVILADINGNGLLDIFISGGSKAIRAYEMPSVKVPVGGVFWMPE